MLISLNVFLISVDDDGAGDVHGDINGVGGDCGE